VDSDLVRISLQDDILRGGEMGLKANTLASEVAKEVQSLITDLQAIIYRANQALDYLACVDSDA